ncbi:MAG TPA: Gfo/Idh/MocA family oxidoreductase [Saprospiraceae bacterium]|nr:Gfo/Idh/MocA family oxidoreductase [Saprospiraceae bacterium]HMQ81593.1 Gfo/Idh/MocA family oxidoreductase [Saprospiraceae bacterium]
MTNQLNRRDFLQRSTLAGIGLAGTGTTAFTAPAIAKSGLSKSKINVGVIGTGLRGQGHIDLLLRRDDCEITAICDINQQMIDSSLDLFKSMSKPAPKVIGLGEQDYLQMLDDETLDAVLIATPWRWHSEMAIAAMQAGKYVGMEVCGGFSLDECWQLVNTHEATGSHLFFLENVCYRRDVMAVLNMVRQDLFGELIHLEGGYQHDLRGVKFNDGKTPYDSGVDFGDKGFSEAQWRTHHSIYRNGDLYPTHGVGPLAQYLHINRGNRFLYLTSISSQSRGLHEYIVNHPKGGPQHPNAQIEFRLGDVVTTLIKTSQGQSVLLSHDTNLPRPYSLGFRVQGTKGLWMDVNQSLHIEGKSPAHRWESTKTYFETYDHPLWKKYEPLAEGAGHGGMDWFLINDFVECAKENRVPPFDAYDAATWLAITPLSEQSIAAGSQPMPFPDFTRGRWMHRQMDFAM